MAPDIHVLLTIDPSNYPLGIKSILIDKDGGEKVFTSPLQNQLIENEIL